MNDDQLTNIPKTFYYIYSILNPTARPHLFLTSVPHVAVEV